MFGKARNGPPLVIGSSWGFRFHWFFCRVGLLLPGRSPITLFIIAQPAQWGSRCARLFRSPLPLTVFARGGPQPARGLLWNLLHFCSRFLSTPLPLAALPSVLMTLLRDSAPGAAPAPASVSDGASPSEEVTPSGPAADTAPVTDFCRRCLV